ncbi:MAG TPA: hypothetical protein VNI01_08315, partial [Elusimicrobiota bacterium]|nr:hypothetical protein [Elusimicrobiota bacterium]
ERLGRVWLGYLTGDRLNEWRGRTSEDKNLIVSNEKVLEVGVQHYAWRGSSDSGGWRYEKETELLKHREDIAGTSVGGRIGGAIDSIPVLGWALDKSAKTGQTLYYGSKGGAQAGSAMISGDDVAALHALGTIYRSPGFRWLAGEERFLKKLEASGDALDVVKGKAQEQRLAALRSEGLSAGTVLPGAWRAYVGAELSDKELVEALAGYGDTAAQLREAAQSPGGSALWNATLRGLSIGAQAGDMGGTMLFDPATLALGGLGARVAAMKGEIGALKEAVALGKVPAWKAAPALDSALRTQRALSGVSLGASGLFAVPMAGGLADDLAGLVNARDLDEALQRGTGAAFNGLLAGHMLTGAVAKRAGAEPADSRASRGGSDWLAGKAIDPESPAAAAKVAEMRAQLLDVVQNNPKLRASLERYLEAALPKEKVGDTMARLEKAIRELDVRFADPADVGDAIARYRSPVDPSASGPRVILLNADLAVASAPTPELLPTLLHELGHHLGLGEPGAHRLQVYLDRALNPEPRSGKLSAPAESDARAREAVGSGRLISELKKEYVADLYADRDADTALAVAKDSLRQQVRIRAAAEEMRGLMERGEWNAVPDKPAWLAERLRTSDRALNVPEDLKAYNDLLQQALRKGGAKNAVPTLLADLDASIARQERLVDGLRRQLGIGVPGEPAPQPPAPPQGGWLKKLTGFFDGGGEQDRAARFASEPQPEAVAQILGELRSPRFQGEGRSAIGVFVDSSGRVAAMGDVVPDGIAKNPAYLSVTLSLGALDRIDLQASPGVASLPRAARRNLEAAVERYNRELGQGR